MIELHKLPKTVETKAKRLGRGHGSGRGKTAGRGTKGQKARETIKFTFEGGQLPLTKRLPFVRGKLRNAKHNSPALVLNLKDLEKLPANTIVDFDNLVKNKILKEKFRGLKVKLLGVGEVKVPLVIKVHLSKGAKAKIEKAGGKCE